MKARKSSTKSKARKTIGSRAKKSGVKAAPASTKTFAGERFTKNSCGKTKAAAKKTADTLRSKGKKARVVKSKVGYCVYTRG